MTDIDEQNEMSNNASQQPVILYVEDDVDTAKLVQLFLSKKGYTVIHAADATQALLLLEEYFPDMIICDILMPNMDGYEFRNLIWQDPDLQFVPFIFLTAVVKEEYQIKGYEAFADDYITKPFDFNQLSVRVASRLKKYQLLRERIHFDTLTRVYSRRFVSSLLSKELERVKRLDRSVSIALLDIDNFKLINDTYGHVKGDYVLYTFAQEILNCLRKYDYVGRYGGEEFIVVMPETEKFAGREVMERIRRKLVQINFSGVALPITFSAGVTSSPLDGFDLKTLLQKADKALYRAKGAGKNTIVVYE